MSMAERKDEYWVVFRETGQKFPVRYMMTMDAYEVELPCGLYTGVFIKDLRRVLRAEFDNVRVTK